MPNPRSNAVAISSKKRSTKPLVLASLTVAAMAYGCLFLWQPIERGLVGSVDEEVSRGRFVLLSLLYPEVRLATWLDGGRLPSGFSDRIPIVFGTVVWLALSGVIGLPLVRPLFPRNRTIASRIEQLSIAILVGLALLSTTTLVVGLVGGLKSRVPLTVAVAVLILLVYGLSRSTKRISSGVAEPDISMSATARPKKGIDQIFFVVIVAMTVFAAAVLMLGSWLPPSEFDVLEYHLQAPKEFFQQGWIGFVPHNIYANMPLGTEMHSLAMMTMVGEEDAWLGGLIGKSITAAFSLVGAALLGAFVTRKFGALFGWCAAGMWLTSPGIAHVAIFGLIDGVLATYVLASAVAIIGALESLRDRTLTMQNSEKSELPSLRSMTYWRLAGVASGAAAAAKYPGLILAVIPVLAFLIWAAWRYRRVFHQREVILSACLIALELAATCGPWYVKNWVQAGNPVYPLAANIFGGKTLTPNKIDQWKRAHTVRNFQDTHPTGSIESISILLRPVSIALSDATRLGLTSLYVQPAMVLGLLVCMFATFKLRQDRHFVLLATWIGWSVWIVLVWWFATHRIDRFWLPLTGLWAGLGATGFWWLYQNVSPRLSQSIVVLGLGYGCVLNSSPTIADNRYFVSIAALRADAGDENQVPRIFPTTAWVNQNLPNRKARILLVGEARVFDFIAPIEYSTCFDVNPAEVYLKGKSRTEQLTSLRQRGITHILIQWTEIHRYRYPNNYGFSEWPQPSDIQKLVDDGVVSRVDWGFPISFAELLEVK